MAEKTLTLPDAKALLPIDVTDLDLLPKEYKFLAYYFHSGFDGAKAAKIAGYKGSKEILRARALSVLKRPNVNLAMRRILDVALAPYRERVEYEVMTRYYRRATYTIDDFVYPDGSVKALDDIPKEWREVIDGVLVRYAGGASNPIRIVEYKLPDRDMALKMLYTMVTGTAPGEGGGIIPAEARERLTSIFAAAQQANRGALATKTEVAVTQTTVYKRGNGRPRNDGSPAGSKKYLLDDE
jgi:hypothetical protein